jgi:alanine dehydrogenase
MPSLTLGLIRERKTSTDNRVALTPRQCRELRQQHPEITVVAEPSDVRCFPDEAYREQGISVSSDLTGADWLIGVKEVPPQWLIPDMTYAFFSHTIKKQPHNRELLRTVLDKRIRMIDLELLTDEQGNRLIGFGRYAGIVGAHYGLLMYGQRTGAFHMEPAHALANYQALVAYDQQYAFPPFRAVIAGDGRVGKGAQALLQAIGLREVSPAEYLAQQFDQPVFTVLPPSALYQRKDGQAFRKDDFKAHPETYESAFAPYTTCTDILINAVYWDSSIPRHFGEAEVRLPSFRITTIADVSCDMEGAVPITVQHTTSDDPVYGCDRQDGRIGAPYHSNSIDVMAISNLPNELPKDASADFGSTMKEYIIPAFLQNPRQRLFHDATIAEGGFLAPAYQYLQDFVEEAPADDP